MPTRLLACLGVLTLAALASAEDAKKLRFYIGTYTGGTKSAGIYRAELDPATGKLSGLEVAARMAEPSFLAIHPKQKHLYAVGETGNPAKKTSGVVAAFAINAKGDLEKLNEQSSEGAWPCHIIINKAGTLALAANYGGGNACALPIGPDGKLGKATSIVQHRGKGANPARQKEPHAHSINLDQANRFAFVADLGLDRVMIYRLDEGKGTLTPNDPAFAALAPGAGPRHFAFHPSGKYAYVINELDSTVTAFRYDAKRGALEAMQTVPTLPDGFKGKTSTAEVVVHPSGRFLYGSNRGHDSIAAFRIDPETGKLTPTGHQNKGIATPRNFVVDPTGAFCLVANQKTGSIVVFRIDRDTGALTPTPHRLEVPAPVCIRFLNPAR